MWERGNRVIPFRQRTSPPSTYTAGMGGLLLSRRQARKLLSTNTPWGMSCEGSSTMAYTPSCSVDSQVGG